MSSLGASGISIVFNTTPTSPRLKQPYVAGLRRRDDGLR